jgi:hypothetical protein
VVPAFWRNVSCCTGGNVMSAWSKNRIVPSLQGLEDIGVFITGRRRALPRTVLFCPLGAEDALVASLNSLFTII